MTEIRFRRGDQYHIMAGPFKAILAVLLVAVTVFSGAIPTDTSATTLTLLTEELPPLNFTQDGKLMGFSVDVVREIQRRVGNTDSIEVVPWARGYKAALERPNTVLFSTARTQEREPFFNGSVPWCAGSTCSTKSRARRSV
ncbi:MAG: transporter substrate-binding domain-containing protein [Candidatus Competibacteraceae bacterium]|nr:transporter substrate-binding domain-containing protein [Candidatus Competibacteraceae bacterium]